MEFSEIIREYKRMCASFNNNCDKCNLHKYEGPCDTVLVKFPKDVEQIVLKWAKNNPKVTNKTKFEEIFKGQPWKDYITHSNCYATTCGPSTPCISCPWWFDKYEED